jgi:hypothetical protein
MAFFDVQSMGGAGRRGRPSKKGGVALTTASMGAGALKTASMGGASNKRNPLHFGRGVGVGGKYVGMPEGGGIFSSLLGAIGLGADGCGGVAVGGRKRKGGVSVGGKIEKGSVRNKSTVQVMTQLAQQAKEKIKNRAHQLQSQGYSHADAMLAARNEHKLSKSRSKKGGVSVGGVAIGGLDMGEKKFLRAINHSPAQMKLAKNYGQLTKGKLGMVHHTGGMVRHTGGMVRHQTGEMNMLPYPVEDMDGSGIFSSLLGAIGLGVTDDNLHALQQLEHQIEAELPVEHKGAGRMLIHHAMRHMNKHGNRSMKGAGWFDDIVSGFTGTIEKLLPLVPHIIPHLGKIF